MALVGSGSSLLEVGVESNCACHVACPWACCVCCCALRWTGHGHGLEDTGDGRGAVSIHDHAARLPRHSELSGQNCVRGGRGVADSVDESSESRVEVDDGDLKKVENVIVNSEHSPCLSRRLVVS